jgi:hypothetical protein
MLFVLVVAANLLISSYATHHALGRDPESLMA